MKIKDIIQSRLRWYGHVIRQDINYQIREIVGACNYWEMRRVNQGNRGKGV